MKTSVSFLGIYNSDIMDLALVLLFNLFGSFVFRIFIHWNIPIFNIIGTVKWRKVSTNKGERMFWLNLFLSPAPHYYKIATCSLFWKTEIIISWLFFLLDSLSENNLVSKNMDLLKNNVGNKLTWKFERFGKCVKRITYLGIILSDA